MSRSFVVLRGRSPVMESASVSQSIIRRSERTNASFARRAFAAAAVKAEPAVRTACWPLTGEARATRRASASTERCVPAGVGRLTGRLDLMSVGCPRQAHRIRTHDGRATGPAVGTMVRGRAPDRDQSFANFMKL